VVFVMGSNKKSWDTGKGGRSDSIYPWEKNRVRRRRLAQVTRDARTDRKSYIPRELSRSRALLGVKVNTGKTTLGVLPRKREEDCGGTSLAAEGEVTDGNQLHVQPES